MAAHSGMLIADDGIPSLVDCVRFIVASGLGGTDVKR